MPDYLVTAISALGSGLTIGLALYGALSLWWIYGPSPAPAIDPRTGRPFGDHGTTEQAHRWIYDVAELTGAEELNFLKAWNHGEAHEDWPEFYVWLAENKRLREALEAIIQHGVERDLKWAGMTARDIALAGLSGQPTTEGDD